MAQTLTLVNKYYPRFPINYEERFVEELNEDIIVAWDDCDEDVCEHATHTWEHELYFDYGIPGYSHHTFVQYGTLADISAEDIEAIQARARAHIFAVDPLMWRFFK